jgi:hypothetical protein
MEKSAENVAISNLIKKYGTLALILEEGCNSVFRTDKYQLNVSILKYFIENIKHILQYEDENIRYNSIKIFIAKFIDYINLKKKEGVDIINKSKKTFGKYTTCEGFIRNYPSDEFKKYKNQFIEVFNEY